MNLISDVKQITDNDTYSMILMMLFTIKNIPEYSTISELAYVLDHDNFLNFIKYYEGQTIKVPSIDDVTDAFKLLTLYENHIVNEMDWWEALDKSGFSFDDSSEIRRKLKSFVNALDEYKIGEYMNDLR